MAAHHAHPLLESRLGRQFAGIQVMPRVPEDPGIVERAAPDAHSGAAGLLKHHFRRCRTDHIAIADHRNGSDRRHHRPDAGRLTVPPKPCSRVRPCTKIAATPTSSSARAKSGAVRFSSSQPRRIFAVIGIFTALTMPFTSAAVAANSVIIAEPPPTRQTLRTGQPMLMSTAENPAVSR